jgi:two-component system, chemotaxis family, chemotaxis protein CheY
MPKILIVDDASFMRNMIGSMVKEIGYREIYFAIDGFDAVEKAKELQPELITLDISMPGMDGLEAVSKIMQVSPNSKVIMLTAVDNQFAIKEALKNGAVDFLKKPIAKSELEDRFKRFL